MPEACDLLVRARRILTPAVLVGGEDAGPGFLAIRAGTIVAVGEAEDADSWEGARTIDVGDATVVAGIVDAHIHPIAGIGMTRGADLSGLHDLDQVRAVLRAWSTAHPEGWILGWGLDPNAFGESIPSLAVFDGLPTDRPGLLQCFDAHSAIASAAALRLAGVTGEEEFSDASAVVIDASGTPSGLLLEHGAIGLVQQHVPPLSFGERVSALGEILQGMAETGVTSGQMLDLADPDAFDLLDELERRGELPLRLRISPMVHPGADASDWEELCAIQGRHGRRWHVAGVKLMIDGTIDNGTAWLFAPDTLGESTASLWLDPEEYAHAIRFFHERGVRTTTHAIGDRGLAFVAETLAALAPNGTAHRIEHIETLPDDVLELIVGAGVAVSMQPTHCAHFTRADGQDNWSRRLGPERASRAWRIRDLHERGVVVALGSDWPVAPYDPRGTLAAAVLRRPGGHPEIPPVHAAQAMAMATALDAHTRGWWQSVGERGGALEVGMPADLTIFADDPLTTSPDRFMETPVVMTVVDGQIAVDRLTAHTR